MWPTQQCFDNVLACGMCISPDYSVTSSMNRVFWELGLAENILWHNFREELTELLGAGRTNGIAFYMFGTIYCIGKAEVPRGRMVEVALTQDFR